jgi:hypothetical protein
MQKGIQGRVMAVNHGWNFVVLSVGDKQGAVPNKQMVIVRDGQAIGKLRITNVERNQSVADVIPSSMVKGAVVEPGDSVIYVGDEKPGEAAAALPQP